MNGAGAIASGGFGCVFNPPIKCKASKDTNKQKDKISKLMYNHYANEELKEIQKFSPLLKKIPNYNNFFMIDNIFVCKPKKLNEEDKLGFNKCRNFKDITEKNVNSNLDSLSLLNVPFGGISVREYIRLIEDLQGGNSSKDKINMYSYLNYKLIKVMTRGIIPMNKLNILHNDIKGDNLLIDDTKKSKKDIKIIDWGLSLLIKDNLNLMSGRPIQFNIPFSVILFNKNVLTMIHNFKNYTKRNNIIHKELGKKEFLRVLATEIVAEVAGSKKGHYDYVSQNLIPNLYDFDKMSFDRLLVNQYTKILEKYYINDTFKHKVFFNEVYKQNADIFGILMTYYEIIIQRPKSKITDTLRAIILEYCFSDTYCCMPIPIPKLVKELNDLFGIFEDSQRYSIISEKNTEINSDIYTKNTKNDSLRYVKLKSKLTFVKSKTKKCKKGTHKNKHGLCVDKLTVKKRCKNGYRRNKQGICSPK